MSAPPQAPLNNIISIASGKGGVGKTWLAITLAQLFARSGRRILLFDGDIGLANVDVQLGLTPEKGLGMVLKGDTPLAEVVIHDPLGFDIIAGRSGSTGLVNLSSVKLMTIKNQLLGLASQYDAIIVDLGAGIEQYVQFMASLSSRCIVVVTDEPTSLTDAYAFVKFCTTRLKKTEITIVVNQSSTQKDGERTYEALSKACSSFLHYSPPLLGVVRKDNKVRDAIRTQTTIINKSPHSTAASDVAAMSVRLMQKM